MKTITKERAHMLIDAIERTGSPLVAADIRLYISKLEERLKVMEEFAEWSSQNWDNQDISHADFRVLCAVKSKHAIGVEG